MSLLMPQSICFLQKIDFLNDIFFQFFFLSLTIIFSTLFLSQINIFNNNLRLQILRKGIVAHFTDAYSVHTSNWTRWVNCARRAEEESVVYVYCAGRVYLILTKDMAPGHELLFYYGDDYAELLGIHYKTNNKEE